jgi:hypothetical protein
MTDVSESEATPRNFTVALKGGCGTIEVNASMFNDEVYEAVFLAGLESIINKQGMSKLLPGISKLEGEEKAKRTQEVREQAEKTVQAMYAGSIKGAVKTKKASNAVETEALRLAKNMARDIIKANGQRVGAYTAKEQTVFAKAVLERNRASLIATAEKNLEERAEGAKALTMPSLKEVFGEKADSEEVKAKPRVTPKRKGKDEVKTPISAAQAGKVAPRQKPLAQHLTH